MNAFDISARIRKLPPSIDNLRELIGAVETYSNELRGCTDELSRVQELLIDAFSLSERIYAVSDEERDEESKEYAMEMRDA